MTYNQEMPAAVLHWNYRGFTDFPISHIVGDENKVTDIYLKENLISRLPSDIGRLVNLESLYLSGNDISELPPEISMLRCLKCLDVSGNRLKHIPDNIGQMRSLKFLILDENELTELPLRLSELRALRYLSVCDNKLEWLPQRPVYNYYHCEFRFWRNTTLKAIPYSLWYHMFRDQQTRSLNIGCLQVPKYQQTLEGTRFSLKFYQDSREWECDIRPPAEHSNIITNITPPSLYEISKRVLYDLISETAKNLNTKNFTTHSYNSCYIDYTNQCNKLSDLDKNLDDIKDSNGNIMNGGGNNIRRQHCFKNSNDKMIYHTADIIEENVGYLPNFMKIDLGRGPISKCENVNCKKNIFDYVLYEFILEKIILIDNIEDVILSATFCSKKCAESWRNGKRGLITWKLRK